MENWVQIFFCPGADETKGGKPDCTKIFCIQSLNFIPYKERYPIDIFFS